MVDNDDQYDYVRRDPDNPRSQPCIQCAGCKGRNQEGYPLHPGGVYHFRGCPVKRGGRVR